MVVVSDISGEVIARGEGVTLAVSFDSGDPGLEYDLTREELTRLLEYVGGPSASTSRSLSGVRTTDSEVKTVVWTDGSCNANGVHGRGGWAALIEQAGIVREVSGSADATTHNRMELTAICEALETLTGAVEVRTDSTYVEKCFNENWHERWLRDGAWKGSKGRPVKNRDLWERLFGLVWNDGGREVTFKWIKRDSEPNNHRVDRLARATALSAG